MTRTALCLSTAFGLLVFPQFVTAQGNLVVNGSFSDSAIGWTLTNSPGFGSGYSVGGNPGGCLGLDNIAPSDLSDPTASQTIHGLTPGVTYVVSGQYRRGKDRGGGSPTDPGFGVAMDGTLFYEAVIAVEGPWQSFVFLYTATSDTALLSLSSQRRGTGMSCYIDNIAVQPFPSLSANIVGPDIVLSWHTNVVGFALQSSTHLQSPSNWQDVTNGPTIAGSNYTVTLSATNRAQFLRLKL